MGVDVVVDGELVRNVWQYGVIARISGLWPRLSGRRAWSSSLPLAGGLASGRSYI